MSEVAVINRTRSHQPKFRRRARTSQTDQEVRQKQKWQRDQPNGEDKDPSPENGRDNGCHGRPSKCQAAT